MSFVIGFVITITLLIALWLMISYINMLRKKVKVEKSWLIIMENLMILGDLIQTLLQRDRTNMDFEKDHQMPIELICTELIQSRATDEIMSESRRLSRLLVKIEARYKLDTIYTSHEDAQLLIDAIEVRHNICNYWQEYNALVGVFNQTYSKIPTNLAMIILGEGLLPLMVDIE